ncbi:hypothetical protein MRB53_025944 [Persea americana]|uniref:Uncharacterized protein n=1 Tax=Persea americana TaxID=3435 RepID=A0ACC2LHL2_PERAE|nr:hypothetical protein MRB53_025944 [Persea americana]
MMPFGAGRWMCPGLNLAMLHLEYFVVNMMREFEWKTVEGEEVDLTEKQEVTIVMKKPLKVKITQRRSFGMGVSPPRSSYSPQNPTCSGTKFLAYSTPGTHLDHLFPLYELPSVNRKTLSTVMGYCPAPAPTPTPRRTTTRLNHLPTSKLNITLRSPTPASFPPLLSQLLQLFLLWL